MPGSTLWAALALISAAFLNPARAASPERVVTGSRIVSQADPAVTITLPRNVQYLGADRWDLYDICDAELHVFVEADPHKQVKTLYWVQFEQYLPNNTHIYDYSKDESVQWAGWNFWQKARFGASGDPQKPGSDGEHVFAMVAKAGFTMPADTMNVRLVRVLDEARRKELMFIYIEDLAPTGFTSAQLMDGGQVRREWQSIKAALVERARKRIRLKH